MTSPQNGKTAASPLSRASFSKCATILSRRLRMPRTDAVAEHPRAHVLHQPGLVEGLQASEHLAVDPGHLLLERHPVARERARVVDEDQVPLAVHQEVARVAVDVRDQVVEDLLPADLLRPVDRPRARRLVDLLDVLAALDPEHDRGEVAAHPPLDARRHHVEAEEAVELVGGDLRLVGLPEARAMAHGQVLDRGARGEAPRREEAPLGLGHADRDLLHALDGRRPQVLLELRVPADPDLGAHRRRRARSRSRARSPEAGPGPGPARRAAGPTSQVAADQQGSLHGTVLSGARGQSVHRRRRLL